jgi:hypothetical protein
MAKTGKRRGAGRKRGVRNRKTRALQEGIEASGLTPLDYMLAVMRNPRAKLADRDVYSAGVRHPNDDGLTTRASDRPAPARHQELTGKRRPPSRAARRFLLPRRRVIVSYCPATYSGSRGLGLDLPALGA